MSSANSLRVLELESQGEVLERLQLLSNFGSSLITVTGSPGAGKTWIAQRYLEAWADEKNQALLMCFPNQDNEQRRSTILSQISSQSYFDPSASLAESLSDFYHADRCNIVIVVDDAQLLSETLISELWMLVLEAQSRPEWSINVILFSLPNLLDTLLTRLSYGQEHKPVDVEIEVLSDDDADRFFEFYVMRYVEPDMEKRVRHAYNKVKKTPGDIMALGEQKMEKRVVIRSIIGSPVNITIIIVLLLVLIGGGYYWMLKDGLPEPESVTGKAGSEEQAKSSVLPDTVQENVQALKNKLKESNGSESELMKKAVKDGAKNDSYALPPAVTSTVERVGVEDSNRKRVVISSDVVDALMDGEKSPEKKVLTPGDVPPSEPVRIESPELTNPADDAVSSEKKEPDQQQQAPDITFSFARDKLLAMPDRSYTLQLGAFNTLQETEKFIKQYQLQGQNKVYVYPTFRDGEKWIIVTYDEFPTIQLARDAVDTLSPELQRLGPWAKSLRQVHREVDRAK
ncbi:AAA family ATPase [Vibrio salinus]|uniref:AAA family ATPase n=1 Tax=Vibrio salinus TaxID=2899784 RepID=UPI001E4CFD58|nr:AAA family ATPase [Vibrio salinus]MCE0493967.1 AAA family ATPase [Vibrio salinus]